MRVVPVIDTHAHFLINGHYLGKDFARRHRPPWAWNPLRNFVDLPRLREGLVSSSAFTVYVPNPPFRGWAWRACNRVLDTLDDLTTKLEADVTAVDSAEQIRTAHGTGRHGALATVEGAHVLEGKIERVVQLRRRGVRLLTLTHFVSNGVCDGHVGPQVHGGLSGFGRDVLRACHEHGVIPDLSHASDRAFDHVLADLDKPPVVTHTALRGDRKSQRFITEKQVRAVAERGGVIGVVFWPWYLEDRNVFGGIDLVADTYARMADLVGPKHLILGSDMDAFNWLPRGMKDVSDLPRLAAALLDRGFGDEDLVGVLGGNFLRVLDAW